MALESGIQLKKSGIPLTIGIRNPNSTDEEPGSRIHCVESRIQDCLARTPLLRATQLIVNVFELTRVEALGTSVLGEFNCSLDRVASVKIPGI